MSKVHKKDIRMIQEITEHLVDHNGDRLSDEACITLRKEAYELRKRFSNGEITAHELLVDFLHKLTIQEQITKNELIGYEY